MQIKITDQKILNKLSELKNILFQKEIIDDTKITITTYHSSKGLEAKVVIILNINDIKASEKLIIHAFNFDEGLVKEI